MCLDDKLQILNVNFNQLPLVKEAEYPHYINEEYMPKKVLISAFFVTQMQGRHRGTHTHNR